MTSQRTVGGSSVARSPASSSGLFNQPLGIHVMLSIQWCLALGASFKPLGDYLQITPMERYKWSVAARSRLGEQLGLLKLALLTSKWLAIHSTLFIISNRARSIKGLTGRWEFVEIFSRISTIADLAPAVAELQSILALPAVTTAEA